MRGAKLEHPTTAKLAGSTAGAEPGTAVRVPIPRAGTYLLVADGAVHARQGDVGSLAFDDVRLPGDAPVHLELAAGWLTLAASSTGGFTRVWLLEVER